ncbi:hypothetical protein ONZ51_g12332 [Trametes cubensis]|uniref:Ser-Thr-rich glycosyl-phosphatidyl-inositol-anchored membrane family-domain-containing protein n=1 Tax=Trametes cubensis TaxID=1111947 RepID=A0AAD7TG43_9APHY|nr:hypothetical protein ONZ51_g12332 [Trametes cubensis]
MRTVFYTVVSLAALALAQIQSHDPNPPVLEPHSGTEWTVGATETVSWDTTGIIVNDPAGRPLTGQVVLGYVTADSQFLWQTQPLTKGFLLSEKQTQVVVPNVPSGKYFIALEGDTGNWSQQFTIKNPAEPSGTPPKSIVVTPVSSGTASTTSSDSTSSAQSTSTSSSASVTITSGASTASRSTTSSGTASSTSDTSATSSGTSSGATATAPSGTTSSATSLATVLSSSSSSSAAPTGTNSPNGAQSWKAAGSGVVIPAVGLFVAGMVAF